MYNAKVATYRLDIIDLEILLAYMEVDCMWGFSAQKKTDKTEVIQGIHRLAQKNIIQIEDGKIIIKPIYMQLLENIKNMERCIIVESSGIMHKKKCCYVGKEVLISEVSGVKKGEVILYIIEKDRFFELLRDEVYVYDYADFQISETNEWESVEYDNIKDMCSDEEVLFKMEVFEKQHNAMTLFIAEEGEQKWIVVQKKNERTRIRYQIKTMEQLIKRILNGERI